MTYSDIHPFEKAGLGKAPFRYIGQVHQQISYGQAVIGHIGGVPVTTKPGGTCDACGTYIIDMFRIVSADGQKSVVGCDCILKVVQGHSVKEQTQFEADLKALKKAKAASDKKKVKDQARVQAAMERLQFVRGSLAEQPHPSKYLASQGKTRLDYVRWMFDNAGLSGRVQAAKIVESLS
jgi:hypothetical protein